MSVNAPWSRSRTAGNQQYLRSITAEYSTQNLEQRGLQLHEYINLIDSQTDSATLSFLLRSCANSNALLVGNCVHDHMIKHGFEQDPFLGGLLVHMYAKCGSLDDARVLFATLHPRSNVFRWNSLIRAYAQQGQGKEAVQLFEHLLREGVIPDQVTFVVTLSACACQVALTEGHYVHALIVESGLESDVVVGTSLINLYGACGSVENARRMFDKLPQRDVIAWNAMIAVYVQQGQGKDSLGLFEKMQSEGEMPNMVTFVGILSACAFGNVASDKGKQIHTRLMNSVFELNAVLDNALFSMYAKRGNLEDAQQVFDTMHEQNVVSWNAMISAHALHGQGIKSLLLFDQMKWQGVMPNKVTFLNSLSLCVTLTDLAEGVRIHTQILSSGFDLDVVIYNSLVNMYGKCGSSVDAWRIFNEMPQRNLVSWTAMIAAYGHSGEGKKALQVFHQMHKEGVMADKVTFISILDACDSQAALAEGECLHARISCSGFEQDSVVGTALVNMYGKCGSVKNAKKVFDSLIDRNIVSWSAMITVHAQNGQAKEALVLFDTMQREGFVPDSFTLGSILDACANQAFLIEGMLVHIGVMGSKYESDMIVGTALMNMYGKCGSLIDAHRSFHYLLNRDVIAWNTVIAAYAQHGKGKGVFELLAQMCIEGVPPNKVTFISVLSACSHGGLISEGCQFFISMHRDHYITPTADHYECMIDLLGRAGQLDRAEELINSMPFYPTDVSLTALLSACRYQVDVERGKRIALRLFDKDPDNAAPFIMLLNVYSLTGRQNDAAELISMMRNKNLKEVSCHQIMEMDGRLHDVLLDDSPRPQNRVYVLLQKLLDEPKVICGTGNW